MERESSGGIRQPWGWENVDGYEMTSLTAIDENEVYIMCVLSVL